MRDFYNVLFRSKKKIMVFFFSVMTVVILVTFLGSEVYQSEGKLMVRLGRESVTLDPTATTGQILAIVSERENEINSETEILKSRDVAEKLVDAIGVDLILHGMEKVPAPGDSLLKTARYWVGQGMKYPFTLLANLFTSKDDSNPAVQLEDREKAIRRLMDRLEIETAKKSDIISIGYETNDPRLARDVVARLINLYLEKHINVHRTTGSYQFFGQQKETLESSLAQTEENLRSLKNKTGTASITEQQRIVLERIGGMQKELEETESASAASVARVKALRGALGLLPGTLQTGESTGFAQSAADGMRKQIYDLQLKEQELLSTFTAKSIPVQEIRRQIQEGKALLSRAEQTKQVTRGINENHQKIQLDLLTEKSNLSSLLAKVAVLKTQIEGGRGELNVLNDTELRMAQLERDLETQKSNYRKYSDSLEQSRIDQALEMEKISNISVVQPASLPGKTIRPKKLLNLAVGLFLGVFGGIGLAFFKEYQDHSFKKPEDVDDRLNLPALATLPDLSAGKAASGSHLAYKDSTPPQAQWALPFGFNGNSNACGNLLNLFTGGTLAVPCAVAMVGCRSGEGVSTAVGLFARQIATQSGARVLVVDANSSFPSQHSIFNTKLSPGLTDFTMNGRPSLSCIQSSGIENLDVLSAGNGKPELAAGGLKAIARALPALKLEYNHIIFDLPAVQDHAPAMQIAGLMDGVIMVVEAEKTRWEVANRAKEDLLQANSKLIGVILNKRQMHIPDWLYKTL